MIMPLALIVCHCGISYLSDSCWKLHPVAFASQCEIHAVKFVIGRFIPQWLSIGCVLG